MPRAVVFQTRAVGNLPTSMALVLHPYHPTGPISSSKCKGLLGMGGLAHQRPQRSESESGNSGLFENMSRKSGTGDASRGVSCRFGGEGVEWP